MCYERISSARCPLCQEIKQRDLNAKGFVDLVCLNAACPSNAQVEEACPDSDMVAA
jgi:hypothetical protein